MSTEASERTTSRTPLIVTLVVIAVAVVIVAVVAVTNHVSSVNAHRDCENRNSDRLLVDPSTPQSELEVCPAA